MSEIIRDNTLGILPNMVPKIEIVNISRCALAQIEALEKEITSLNRRLVDNG